MSRRLSSFVLASLVLLAPVAAAQPVVIKMASLAPEGSTYLQILKEMGQNWKTISGGKVELRLYPGGVAGDDGDVVRKMRLKTLDAGLLTSAGVANIDRSVFALEIPMLYSSYDEIDEVLTKMSPRLESALLQKGFVVLNWADAGWIRFFTKAASPSPEDLRKLKLFTWAGDDDALEIWKGAGFNPVPLPSTEISTALQTGLVSALPTTPQAAVLLQWYNHAKYMTDVKWALLLGGTVVTKSAWDKVPEELRPKLLQAAKEAGERLKKETRASGDRDVDAMKKRGLTVVSVDAKTEALWRSTAEAAYPKIRGKIVPADAFDEAKKILTEYRQKHPAR